MSRSRSGTASTIPTSRVFQRETPMAGNGRIAGVVEVLSARLKIRRAVKGAVLQFREANRGELEEELTKTHLIGVANAGIRLQVPFFVFV